MSAGLYASERERIGDVGLLQPVLISWSGGKDSCLALYEIQKARDYNVAALLTTVTSDYERVSMHGVRRALLARLADSPGLPLHEVFISKDATNEEYEAGVGEALSSYREQGVEQVVCGDQRPLLLQRSVAGMLD